MTRGESDWEGVRLHVVTGKGGTGKTTVAAALAVALARGGQTVLLCEVEGRQGLARLFDTDPLPYDERRLCNLPNGGGVIFGLAIDAEAALLEYLAMYYRLGGAGRILEKTGAIDFATTVAPGVRDVLLTGKVYEAVRRKEKADQGRPSRQGRQIYDAVVLDAPPTGRITRFLGVNAGVADIARIGPIRQQADSIMRMVRSPQTAVHLVTMLEDMPVQETADGIADLQRAGIPVGGIVANFVHRTPFSPATLRRAAAGRLGKGTIERALRAADLPTDRHTVAGLQQEAAEHGIRMLAERVAFDRLEQLRRPTYELGYLVDGVDRSALFTLAGALEEQGMA